MQRFVYVKNHVLAGSPPCVNKIIEYGITKVVYAMKDTTLTSNCDEILTMQVLMWTIAFRMQKIYIKIFYS